jgi:rSAM/selenodomain-associated transferase 1
MATVRAMPEVAILAKAPIPGYAKTRLIPYLGADAAAAVQRELLNRALATARAAGIGPVTLWCAPDCSHDAFREAAVSGCTLRPQPERDLGRRMLAAFEAGGGPLVLIGTDCPIVAPQDLTDAAAALADGADVVIAPAEDGGYGLIAARRPYAVLFDDMPWSTLEVAALTRVRARGAGLRLRELRTIWDVDTAADYDRAVRGGFLVARVEHGEANLPR